MSDNKQVEFVGRVLNQIYSSDEYKMYAVEEDREKYGE
jgi:hypothetical protein